MQCGRNWVGRCILLWNSSPAIHSNFGSQEYFIGRDPCRVHCGLGGSRLVSQLLGIYRGLSLRLNGRTTGWKGLRRLLMPGVAEIAVIKMVYQDLWLYDISPNERCSLTLNNGTDL